MSPEIVGRLRPPRLSSAPATPAIGELYADTGLNQLLYWNGTTWVAGSGGGGGLTPTAQSGNYTASANQLVLMTGANTVTLPSAPATGSVVAVEALTATVTVNRGGTDTINLASTPSLTSVGVAIGTQLNFTYLSGVWYAAQGSAGAVELNATYAARAYRNTAFNLSAGNTLIPLDTKAFDPGNNVNVTTGRYVCPVAGYYQVEGSLRVSCPSLNTTVGAMLFRSGSFYSDGDNHVTSVASETIGVGASDIIQCNAGDYIQLYAYTNAANASLYIGGWTENYLSVHLVAATAVQQQPLQVASQARAYRAAALTPATGATKIPLDTASYDAGQNFSTANGRYVCPVGGFYQVNGGVTPGTIGTGNTGCQAMIYKNGVQVVQGGGAPQSTGQGNWSYTVSDVLQCNAGDYLELWVYMAGNAQALYINPTANFLSVSLVGTQPTAAPANAARAYRNAALTPAASTWTKIPLDTISSDPGGNISLANGRYVCPVAGVYDVMAGVNSQVSGTGTYTGFGIGIYKNGTLVVQDYKTVAVQQSASAVIADKIQCNAGDYLELWIYNSQGTALSVASPLVNFLSVSLLTAAPAPLPVTTPQVVTTSLPSSPVDGQECYFVADATNGIVWHLKYRSASASTHKWELVGGSHLYAGPLGSVSSTASFPIVITGGPSLTLPLPGDYQIDFGVYGQCTSAPNVTMYAQPAKNGSAFSQYASWSMTQPANAGQELARSDSAANLIAGDVITVQAGPGAAGPGTSWSLAWLKIRPTRVG